MTLTLTARHLLAGLLLAISFGCAIAVDDLNGRISGVQEWTWDTPETEVLARHRRIFSRVGPAAGGISLGCLAWPIVPAAWSYMTRRNSRR